MRIFKIVIVSMDPGFLKWRSLPSKIKEIRNELNTVLYGRFIIDVEHIKGLRPEINKEGKITHDWMDGLTGPYIERGYDFCVLHMSEEQQKSFGIRSSLNGAAHTDSDPIGEAYVMCDENDRRGTYNKFVQVVLHEMRHLLCYGARVHDDTHKLHGARNDIRGQFSLINMAIYDLKWHYLKSKVTLLQSVLASLQRMFKIKTLYQAATSSLGADVSPKDLAADMVGCAETASMVIKKVVPDFPVILGTYTMWKKLETDPQFRRVTVPMPGTIIISPTGTSLKSPAPFPGHVGFFLEGDKIASNTSANGLFEQNYTLETWKKRWEATGKYPVYYYQLIV